MPRTLRWASVVLAMTALTCAAVRLLSALFPSLDITIEGLTVVSTVMGLFLLYWPSSNAYFGHVRKLRAEARSSNFLA